MLCWTILYNHFIIIDPIFYKKISNVNVPGISSARIPAILFHEDCALVILKDDIIDQVVSLVFQKVKEPNTVWKIVTHANEFGVCGTLRIDTLL